MSKEQRCGFPSRLVILARSSPIISTIMAKFHFDETLSVQEALIGIITLQDMKISELLSELTEIQLKSRRLL